MNKGAIGIGCWRALKVCASGSGRCVAVSNNAGNGAPLGVRSCCRKIKCCTWYEYCTTPINTVDYDPCLEPSSVAPYSIVLVLSPYSVDDVTFNRVQYS